jgi:hypothetical protein
VAAVLLAADGGSVADWVAAIGQAVGALFTAAAVIVALWLAIREDRWRRADQAERDAERADRDAAQARLVTVEPDYNRSASFPGPEIAAVVLNGSQLPIFDVRIVGLRAASETTSRWAWGSPDPDEMTIKPVLPAQERFVIQIAYVDERGTVDYRDTGEDVITIEFVDHAGLRWRRAGNALPERVLDTPDSRSGRR